MIFDKSFRAREPTAKSIAMDSDEQLTLTQLVDFLNLKGVPKKHLSEATYFACLRVLSEAVGKLPLKLNQTLETSGTCAQLAHPLYDVLRYRPNPFATATAFWTSLETMRNHHGDGYAWIEPVGRSARLWMLPSNQVRVWWDDAKVLSETPHIWYVWSAPNGKQYFYSDEEILHVRTWLSLDGVTGLPVRDILKLTLDGSLSSQQMLNRLYENGMTGKAVLQYTGDLNDENAKIFAAQTQDYVDGKISTSKTLIPLPLGSAIMPLNIKLADSEFVDLRKYTALQIAAAFGVKPDQINDYTKSSYSSSEAQQVAFLVDTLLWIVEHYEQEITYKLLTAEERAAGFAFKFNTGVMLRTTAEKQMETLAKGVSNYIYKPNEARSHLDMSNVPEGDRLYASNGSTIPLEMAGKQYEKGET